MRRVNVCLIDDDDWFRNMFSQFMVHACRNISMTSEDLNSWKSGKYHGDSPSSGEYDIYIFGGAGGEYLSDPRMESLSERSVFLYRNEAEFDDLRKTLPTAQFVEKYISASNIVSHINYFASELRIGSGFVSNEGTFFVISVTSTCGGAGKTSFSLILARLLQQKRKRKVLIISMSLLYDIGKYFVHDNEHPCRTLNEYLYHLFAGEAPENSLSLYIMKDRFGVSSFCLPDGVSELPGLERTEMERFIDSLSRSEQFDTLILDLDNSVSEVTAMIAERSEIMFVLSPYGEDTEKVTGRWCTHILDQCLEGPGTMRIVVNEEGKEEDRLRFDINLDRKEGYGSRMKSFSVPYDPHSFFVSDGVCQISMTGSFAAAIDSIVKEVISFA